MKIGIISDTHGSLPAWRAALNRYFSDAGLIIHCGDIFYHAPRNPLPEGYAPLALAEALNDSPVPLLFARGNCDSAVDESLLRWPVAAPWAWCHWEGKTILAWHEGEVRPEAAETRERFRPDLFLTGHTHKARLWREGATLCLNPGSPSLSKTADGRPTVGLVDERGVRLMDLDTGAVIASASWEPEGKG